MFVGISRSCRAVRHCRALRTFLGLLAQLEDYEVIPSGLNPLGELKSGYARIKGPLTSLKLVEQEAIGHLSNGRACTKQLTGQRHVCSGVYFDHEICDSCEVVMIMPYAGLAIRLAESNQDTDVRVGAVFVYLRMESGLMMAMWSCRRAYHGLCLLPTILRAPPSTCSNQCSYSQPGVMKVAQDSIIFLAGRPTISISSRYHVCTARTSVSI